MKTIESWFLADSKTLSKNFQIESYIFKYPEGIEGDVFKTLRSEFLKYLNRGISKKKNLHAKFLINSGFAIEQAAEHPNCPSAKYFIQKLSKLNPN